MARLPLIPCRLLDPRPERKARRRPIAEAVNIPLRELALRTHELPPPEEQVAVTAIGPVAESAVAWLTGHRRPARLAGR